MTQKITQLVELATQIRELALPIEGINKLGNVDVSMYFNKDNTAFSVYSNRHSDYELDVWIPSSGRARVDVGAEYYEEAIDKAIENFETAIKLLL